jgi:hypothetical protein
MEKMMSRLSIVKLKFLPTAKWDRRSGIGAVIGFIAAIAMLTVFVSNDYRSRLGLAVLVAVIILYALPGRFRQGQCPNCGASPSKQVLTLLSQNPKAGSRASSEKESIIIEQGWEIDFLFKSSCKKCSTELQEIKRVFLTKEVAPTLNIALLLARDELKLDNEVSPAVK